MNDLLNAVISVTLVITPLVLLLLLVTPLMDKRYAAGGRYVLWMLVMAGLLMPFLPIGVQKPFTVNLPVPVVTAGQGGSAPGYAMSEDADGSGNVYQANGYRGEAAESSENFEDYESQMAEAVPQILPGGTAAQSESAQITNEVAVAAVSSGFHIPFTNSLSGAIIGIWLLGIIASLLFYLINHFMFVSFVKHWAVPETDPGYLQVLNSERIRLGILQEIPLMRCKGITAPMLMGLFNPVILLPDMDFDSDDLPFIFRHELIHFKRHDLLYKLALTLVKSVHWFNPAVRLMARQANKDIETICDAYTVNGTDIDFRRKYSEVILSMASGPVTCHSQLTTCMNGGKHMLRQRFSNILGGEKKNGALMFVLIGGVMFALGTLVGFNFQPRHEQAANEYAMAVGETAEAMEAENASEAVGSPWTPVEVRVPAGFDRSELAKLVERTVKQSVRNSFSSEYNERYIGSNGHVDASQIYEEPIKKESYHDGVKSLEISSCMADIVVKQGGDRLKVEYDERFKGEYMLTIINGALKIICNDMLLPSTPANSEIFDAKWKQTAIIVTVPEEAVLDSINGASVSGDISIEGVSLSGVSYDHVITAETVSGGIEITDCTAGGRFNLKSTSGDIAVSDCEVEDYITANLVSGDVFFDSCNALNINISAISGYSQLKDCSFGSLNMYAVSGSTNIALKEDASFYDVLFNSVSGSCYMNGAAVETEGVFRQNLTGAQSNITFTSSSGSLWIDG